MPSKISNLYPSQYRSQQSNLPVPHHGQAGLIYLSCQDPISRIFHLAGDKINYIGFYALSSSTGIRKSIVTIINTRTMTRPAWFPIGSTLEQLAVHPLVCSLTIRPIRNNHLLNLTKLSTAIVNSLDMLPQPRLQEVIDSIISDQKIVSGYDFINYTLACYESKEKLPEIGANLDSDLFSDSLEIQIPTHSAAYIEEFYRNALSVDQENVVSLVSQMLSANPSLFRSEIKDLLDEICHLDKTILETIDDYQLKDKIAKSYDKICRLIGKRPSEIKPSSPSPTKDINSGLKFWLENLISQIRSSDASCHPVQINLKPLLDLVDIQFSHSQKVPAMIVPSPSCNDIYLDKYNPNLRDLSKADLLDLLDKLNHLDRSYDYLRQAIIDRLGQLDA